MRTLAWLALPLLLGSCAVLEGQRLTSELPPRSEGDAVEDTGLRAGAASVDLTPVPGFPLGGHSLEGGRSVGVWTRLYARAFYLEDATGRGTAMVVVDMWSVPAGLVNAVVEKLREHPDMAHIGRADVLISATHTHHSHANHSSNLMYNRFASPDTGFDPDVFAFTRDRIASAIVSSVRSAVPAHVTLTEVSAGGVSRNRSMDPFMRNPEAAAWLKAHANVPGCGPAEDLKDGPDRCHAVHDTLSVMTLRRREKGGHGPILGVAGFFAAHPTAMANETDMYQRDFFGVAASSAADALRDARGRAPVVGIFNGAQGDMSPNWSDQTRAETVRLGQELGAHLVRATKIDQPDQVLPVTGPIDNRFTVTDLKEREIDGHVTPRRGITGRSAAGGAEDGRTKFYPKPYYEGMTTKRERAKGHGLKLPMVPRFILWTGLPASAVPRFAPLSTHRVGPLLLAGLPGEFTTVMGQRIRDGFGEAVPDAKTLTVGLASDYMHYFTTPEEYGAQHYEGASTDWGPYSGPLVQRELIALATAPAAPPIDPEYRFRAGPIHRFHRHRRLKRLAKNAEARTAEQLQLEAAPAFVFRDAIPRWPTAGKTLPTVVIQRRGADGQWHTATRAGAPVDDTGTEFITVVSGNDRSWWQWTTRWLGDVGLDGEGPLRFKVLGVEGEAVCSSAFEESDRAVRPQLDACVGSWDPPADPRDNLG